jgi:FtsH-binding integral membrane protein
MPLFPGGDSPLLGLGLWKSVPATIAVETSMFAAGVALYVTMTRPRDGVGRWSLAALVGLLTVIYIANLLGPPPPNATAVATTALGLWLFPLWAWWIDAHRDVT